MVQEDSTVDNQHTLERAGIKEAHKSMNNAERENEEC